MAEGRVIAQEKQQPLGPPVWRRDLEEVGDNPQAGRSVDADALLDPALNTDPVPRQENTVSGYFETLFRIAEGEYLEPKKTESRPTITADPLAD
ncbi:MAG: hypothetical protein F4147_06925 [Gammaproteobacteria bacterium]|nr:hypothetical protein [Gammaproteobacteria bacterium]